MASFSVTVPGNVVITFVAVSTKATEPGIDPVRSLEMPGATK
jgi:hypothetical protein